MAWRGASIRCRRFIDFLMVEQGNHAGRENGKLRATYDQLSKWGIPRKRIAAAIREASERGLVEVTTRGGLFGPESRRTPSRYRLTWIGTLDPSRYATNEWKRFSCKRISRDPSEDTAQTVKKHRVVA